MIRLRFCSEPNASLPPDAQRRMYATNSDGLPCVVRYQRSDDVLQVDCEATSSVHLHVPWVSELLGDTMLTTAALAERKRPYLLSVELARGTLCVSQNYVAQLQQMGIACPALAREYLSEAIRHFVSSITSHTEPARAADNARMAIDMALHSNRFIARHIATHRPTHPSSTDVLLPAVFGVNLGPGCDRSHLAVVSKVFALAAAPLDWGSIEPSPGQCDWSGVDALVDACAGKGLRILAGPILDSRAECIPSWALGDGMALEQVRRQLVAYTQHVARRFAGRVAMWNAAAGTNVGGGVGMNATIRLQLTASIVESLRRIDGDAPIAITLDQPCGEYVASATMEVPPFAFADALIRANVGVSALGLELNLNYWPGGTALTDPLEYLRLINQYASLEVPLFVFVTLPSRSDPDPLAASSAAVIPTRTANGVSAAWQSEWADRIVSLLLSHPRVEGIVWNQWSDLHPHRFAHGGLWDAQGPKPLLETLARLSRGERALDAADESTL